jgi:outer membrane protein assembly complex protein YaeT
LTEVRVEPHLIGNEADPSARLTVGQELTDDLELIYSTNLVDSNDQIWVAEYDVTRRFQTRAVRQSDNSYRLDFQHEVGFGGTRPPRRVPRVRPDVAAVTIDAGGAMPEAELRDLLGVSEGDDFDFFEARRGVERIEERLIERGYLQSRVRLERQADPDAVGLTVRVVAGPRVHVVFEGIAASKDLQDEAAMLWHRGVFDRQRIDDVSEAIRSWLAEDNHLNPTIRPLVDDGNPAERRIVFRVQPGTRFERIVLAFEGASQIEPKTLDALIADQKLERQLFEDPETVSELLQRFYREEGFLAAGVDPVRPEFRGTVARLVVPIREGPRFQIRRVTVSGNTAVATDTLLTDLPAVPGQPFLPMAAENSLQRLRSLYWRRGYNEARSDYALTLDRINGQVDIQFTVHEGRQSVVADIRVEGNDKTSDRLVREQLQLVPGEPLDLGALSRSRKNLYDTRAYSVVDITRQDLEGDVPGDAPDLPEAQKPVGINVAVREVQPIQIEYGASYDTERGPGGLFDISNHNSFGKARVIGLRTRYDAQLREARGTLTQPSLRYWPLQTTANIYYREERNPATEIADGFDVDRKGLSLTQERELADRYVWSYGYRYEKVRTFNAGVLNPDETFTVSPLTTTLTREGRDEVLDASTGSFLSHAFAYSPAWLGSTLPFFKYFGQYFYYLPLQAPERRPFTNEILRPRLVFATGVRVGLAWGSATDIPLSERFFAGGSTTLRDFAQNAVGPLNLDRSPRGGQALLILNNELRVPLFSRFDGVVFADIGNVYDRVSNFSLSDLRESGGVGLRVRTPWFLIRGDYGVVIDRRPGERRSRFYFSIGQAF